MQNNPQTVTNSQSCNIFNIAVPPNYWSQAEFWLACLAAIIFWALFYLFALVDDFPLRQQPLTTLFYISIFVFPVLEEIVFRGLIQESLQKIIASYKLRRILIFRISSANLISSLLFVASHLASQPLYWALATFVPSLIFGYFKDQYQSLKPAIVLHIFYNAGFYLLQ